MIQSLIQIMADIAKAGLTQILADLLSSVDDLLNIAAENFSMFLIIQSELTSQFENIMDKDSAVILFTECESKFTSP